MKQSQLFYKTRKEVPADADSMNASYLVRAGFVEKHLAGAYAMLPLGLRVLKKIQNLVREEMDAIDGQEILMNVLQPKELWQKTGRWDEMDDVMYKSGPDGGQVAMAPTHEEQVVTIAKNKISSYKDLPKSLYQIQTKFRNEPRAKSGLLRGREFMMKDMYSFHATEQDFAEYYEKSKQAYLNFYTRCGLDAKIVEASGGVFTTKNSHEFQVFTPVGEDEIYYCEKCDFAQNKEIFNGSGSCPKCGAGIKNEKGIEVGNIFPLETKYTNSLEMYFKDSDGQDKLPIMGCYGIGLSRVMGTIVEIHFDSAKNKMVWPDEVAPFAVHLISLGKNDEAESIYQELQKANIDVIYDDSGNSAGEKFAEADLVGCPYRVIISAKTIEQNKVEFIDLKSDKTEMISEEELVEKLKK